MSTYPQPSAPGEYPPAAAPPQRSRTALWVTLAVVVAVAVGIGAYFVGKGQGESTFDPGTDKYGAIYDKGYSAGEKAGNASGSAEGQASGEKEGQAAGLEQGTKQGQAQGTAEGATAALGGFDSWETGDSFYVVQLAEGTQTGVPYTISSRVLMDPTLEYTPCEGNPGDLCTFPRATTGGASAQAGDD